MNLSKHITLKEATHSLYALTHGINNEPNAIVLKNMAFVAEHVFEPLRVHFNVPIAINSFYRSARLNKEIGGTANSQHIFGMAIDLTSNGKVTNKQLFDYIRENLPFDQLIWESGTDLNPNWIHVSLTQGKNRSQVLRARANSSGKMMYEDITKQK